jgi:two-component system CheB/CheR fusion protein
MLMDPPNPTSAALTPGERDSLEVESVSTLGGTPGFPIVGLGASAGGLAAFEGFFSGMPANGETGMAYVLVQHLAPDHASILSELVRRYTRMRVIDVEDGMVVEPNCAYVIPPNRDMAFMNGVLHLLEPASRRGRRLSVDFFFSSLAQDLRERAIGIVLSGTGSDGTEGIRAIKAEGGMVIAQSPESTDQDGMPRSAIATGLVDFVLPPAEMARCIMGYVAHAWLKGNRVPAHEKVLPEDTLNKVLVLLRAQTGHDFSQYKRSTLHRRIGRRMALQHVENLDDYLRYVGQRPEELTALFRDLLVGVTAFFRDAEAFGALEEEVIPRLFEGKEPGSAIRVWVPACSTGEEAYSLAILLQERMTALRRAHTVQVFATDIDSHAIGQARAGVYAATIAADVSADRLASQFMLEPDGCAHRIRKGIRDMLVFSEQDVVKDPPFSRLDLISCRNLLIYMSPPLQKKLIAAFHFALNPGGTLFLGTSESVGDVADLFEVANRKARIFVRKDGTLAAQRAALQRIPRLRMVSGVHRASVRPGAEQAMQMRELAEQSLRAHYGAVAALVDAAGDILFLDGRTGQYLEPAPGEPCLNILKMAREGLKKDLHAALDHAATSGQPAHHPRVHVQSPGGATLVNLTVRAAVSGAGNVAQKVFLVVLEEAEAEGPAGAEESVVSPVPSRAANDSGPRIEALRQELRAKEEYLQSTNEELETSNEELRAANEEMQSVNEELQSTNEELETSREELQSLNEELATVNAELQDRVADLSQANNDMNNLLAGVGVGTVFVDHELRIQRFTPAVTQVINLIASDVGRPVGHIASNLVGYDDLVKDVRAVLATSVPREVEVKSRSGAWFVLRVRPYTTLDNAVEGAVITFFEITAIKRAQRAEQEANVIRGLAAVVRDSQDAVTVLDLQGQTLAWNAGAQRLYGWTETEALATNLRDRLPEHIRTEELSTVRLLSAGAELRLHGTERFARDGSIVPISLTASALLDAEGRMYAIATTERERTTSVPATGKEGSSHA